MFPHRCGGERKECRRVPGRRAFGGLGVLSAALDLLIRIGRGAFLVRGLVGVVRDLGAFFYPSQRQSATEFSILQQLRVSAVPRRIAASA